MYSAYQSGQFASGWPVRFSCSPCEGEVVFVRVGVRTNRSGGIHASAQRCGLVILTSASFTAEFDEAALAGVPIIAIRFTRGRHLQRIGREDPLGLLLQLLATADWLAPPARSEFLDRWPTGLGRRFLAVACDALGDWPRLVVLVTP